MGPNPKPQEESPTLSFSYDAPDAAPMLEQLLESADGLEIAPGPNLGALIKKIGFPLKGFLKGVYKGSIRVL